MAVSEQKTVILCHETAAQSWGRDLASAAVLLGMIGVGWAIDSSALQWIASFVWVIWLFSRAVNSPNVHRVTPQEAADILRDKFGIRARP